MDFRLIPPYSPNGDVEGYLSSTLKLSFLDLIDGLHKLDFLENFEAFSWTGTIANGTEVEITNDLAGEIPTSRFITRHSGDPAIVDGDTEWTTDFVYLKNSGSASATVTVIFFK